MANKVTRVPENLPGSFFVDSSCIDCATCRQIAPKVFAEATGHSYVHAQPDEAASLSLAARALLCCPTNSIGGEGPTVRAAIRQAIHDFPQPIADGVHYCGFTCESSFGASSYLLAHEDGNWLIDSPRWVPQLAQRITALGGVANIFLTHRDDVADAALYARHFGAQVFIHERDQDAFTGTRHLISGDETVTLARGVVAVPVPGHTAGSMVMLAQDNYLFSGDHLWWNAKLACLGASHSACWFSWSQQQRSMEKLLSHPFNWVLPGHGNRMHMPASAMRTALLALIRRMAENPSETSE